ncbi:MAG: M56 family metallopeptidase, partial [Janthinobacterium lividum]
MMGIAGIWLLQMGHACLWGSLWIAVVGIACRLMPRLPASVCAWLWWLACLEILIAFCLTTPISVPILPTPIPAVHAAFQPVSVHPAQADRRVKYVASANSPASQTDEMLSGAAPQQPRWPLWLLGAWIAGVAGGCLALIRQSFLSIRLRHGAFPASLPSIDLDRLAGQMGLRQAPRVLVGPGVDTPCVVGWLHPTILLPLHLSRTLTEDEIRLTLAHEMAHLKRRDLPLALLPTVVRTLFFFHPLVWWAAAEWSAAREEACDSLALSATRLSRADYGHLLLKMAGPTAAAPALGLSPGYRTLRRRLLGLTRPSKPPRFACLFVFALPLLLPWHLTAAIPSTTPHEKTAEPTHYAIAALADGTDSTAAALNDTGQIALTVHEDGDSEGYAGAVGTLEALGSLPKHHASLAYGINAQGQVAGTSFNIPGHGRAFLWDGILHRLGTLPGYPYSEARGVNAAGQVTGFSETGTADQWHAWVTRALIRQPGGALADLGTLGGAYSAAYGINAAGTVVGKADTGEFGATHAFAWSANQMTDLGTLGGADSAAYAISNQGQITGSSEVDGTKTRHAFFYSGGQMRDLGTLPAMTSSAAYALNDEGQVVGASQASGANQTSRATLWQNGIPT